MDIKKPKFEKRSIDEPELVETGPEEFTASLKPKMTEGGVEVAWLNIGLFILVIILASLAAYFAYTKLSGNQNPVAITTETASPEPSASPEASSSPSPTPATTPTATPAAAPAADATPAKADLKISVLNGNGTRGQAAVIAAQIRNAGYAHVTYGNAASYTYKTTLITYKAGRKAIAEDIASVLSSRSTSLEERQISVDVQAILGQK